MTEAEFQKKLAKIRKDLAKRNAEFEKLSKAEKRVAIARGVIADLKAQKIVAKKGTYLRDNVGVVGYFDERTDTDAWVPASCALDELQYGEAAEMGSCTVCGIGALFVSAVKSADKLTAAEAIQGGGRGQGDIHRYLKPWFSVKQLLLIESAFEGSDFTDDGGDNHGITESEYDNAVCFGNSFNSERNETAEDYAAQNHRKMTAIMENIVANKGTFKPPKATKEQLADLHRGDD